MMHYDGYVFVLGTAILIAAPLGFAIRNLLRSKERVVMPILRMMNASGERQAITYKRAPVAAQSRVQVRHYLAAEPARFTQPGRAA